MARRAVERALRIIHLVHDEAIRVAARVTMGIGARARARACTGVLSRDEFEAWIDPSVKEVRPILAESVGNTRYDPLS
jgi:hypothetical protein